MNVSESKPGNSRSMNESSGAIAGVTRTGPIGGAIHINGPKEGTIPITETPLSINMEEPIDSINAFTAVERELSNINIFSHR